MVTEVIYARVPEDVKTTTENFAADQGLTLTSAVVELLKRGLEASANEESIAELETRVAELKGRNRELSAELQGAKSELQTLTALGERTKLSTLGECPNCQYPITGYDLLTTGRCPACNRGLAQLLGSDTSNTGLDQKEFLLWLGAIGALIGIAILAAND